MKKLDCFAIGIGLLAALPAAAATAVTPVWQPTTITEPGHYLLTRDIETDGQDAIVIATGGVRLDLNGYSIRNAGQVGAGVLVQVQVTPVPEPPNDVWIVNGRIGGGANGILAVVGVEPPPPLRLEDLAIEGTALDAVGVIQPMDYRAQKVRIQNAGGHGMRVNDALERGNISIVDCAIWGTAGDGIRLVGAPGGTIERNRIREFGTGGTESAGIRVVSGGALQLVLRENLVREGGQQSHGVILEGNHPTPCYDVADNTIGAVTLHGIDVRSGGARILGNDVSGAGQTGIQVAGTSCLVDGNRVVGSGATGILFLNGNGHAYRNNFLRDNANGGIVDQGNNTDGGGNLQ